MCPHSSPGEPAPRHSRLCRRKRIAPPLSKPRMQTTHQRDPDFVSHFVMMRRLGRALRLQEPARQDRCGTGVGRGPRRPRRWRQNGAMGNTRRRRRWQIAVSVRGDADFCGRKRKFLHHSHPAQHTHAQPASRRIAEKLADSLASPIHDDFSAGLKMRHIGWRRCHRGWCGWWRRCAKGEVSAGSAIGRQKPMITSADGSDRDGENSRTRIALVD